MVYRVIEYKSIYCFFNLLMLGREIECFIDFMVGNFLNDIEY